ncbi:hypothetical protein FLAG1_06255 [Fusarium langsethiae]|uniref:Uncharacterized protein n=1 Tax=Fusarium langsethiae TaxID=179993 RepID=A0A0M9EW57_FUSLA|nr:hypothetical protein FLAG1_06255 [Fusarium langsethiae]GKU03666.1 unnamed protein product [Fusarium langsethiae]GKU20403.1 unnamed protein product [Fusarium langsethiae]
MTNVSVLFNKREIQAMKDGKIYWLIAIKLARLSPQAYKYYSTYLWFEDFIAGLPGPYSPSPKVQHQRIMEFGRQKMDEIRIKIERERIELMLKPGSTAAVTPGEHVFNDGDLIAMES